MTRCGFSFWCGFPLGKTWFLTFNSIATVRWKSLGRSNPYPMNHNLTRWRPKKIGDLKPVRNNWWFRFFDFMNRLRVIIISYVPNQIRIHKSFHPFLNGKMTIVFCHFSQPNVKCNIDKLSKCAWGGVKVNGSLEVKKERCERDKFPDFLWQKIIFIPFSNSGILFNLHVSCKPYFRCIFFHTIASCDFSGARHKPWLATS